MQFGVHIPVIVGDDDDPSLADFVRYGVTAERLGYSTIATSDHVVARGGWVDGPTILSAVAGTTSSIELATAILLPALRHPATVAQTFGTLDRLSGNRVILGVSGGVLRDEFDLMDVPWEERWQRLDEAIVVLRRFWSDDAPRFKGRFYHVDGVGPRPRPERGGPPIWIGSWGSDRGLDRVARLGDGWIASGFNITPERFSTAWQSLAERRAALGKDPESFDNALASIFFYITSDPVEAKRVARDILGPALNRDPDDLLRLALMGSAEECAERLARFRDSGVQRAWIWPATDSETQIQRFAEEVIPLLR
ncbi:MAG: LLM class flavin-dependent oxidoreductase [Nitrolancea sp.]